MKKTKAKRGSTDHEFLILHDLKEILKNIFDLKRFDKRTISRSDITYDSFITIDRLKPNLRAYKKITSPISSHLHIPYLLKKTFKISRYSSTFFK